MSALVSPSASSTRVLECDSPCETGSTRSSSSSTPTLNGAGDTPEACPTTLPDRMWAQHEIQLPPVPRGFHLVTREVEAGLPELRDVRVGMANVFIQHTSASLTINENASPDVRRDFET